MCVCTYVCACVSGEGRGSIMRRRDDQLKKKRKWKGEKKNLKECNSKDSIKKKKWVRKRLRITIDADNVKLKIWKNMRI